MNREIKFRAWDKTLELMVRPVMAEFDNGSWESRFDLEIMQYTGLKDKNGKEIYEGDAIGTHIDEHNLDYDGKPSQWVKVVTWDTEDAAFKILDMEVLTSFERHYVSDWSEDYWGFTQEDASDIEIIGNIYENPELIK